MTCCILFAAVLGCVAWACRRLAGKPVTDPLTWRLHGSSPAND